MNYLAVAGVALLIACVVLLVVLGTEIPLSGKSTPVLGTIFITTRVRTYDGRLCFHRCVSVRGGGSQVSDFWVGWSSLGQGEGGGGLPGLRFLGRLIQPWMGEGGGSQVSVKGKIFDTRFGLIHVQTGKKIFLSRDPPLVKGKFFDTRFGLIHVQTGKKIFVEGPSPSKGKIFWHQIWLDTCSDWKKIFLSRDPPSKGKIFWHQIWLDTCSDWKKIFFVEGPPLVKFFDTRFGLIHVQTGKKNFLSRDPLVKGKFFDTRFGLIHVQTGKKIFLSRDPP